MTDEAKQMALSALVDADHLASCCEKMLEAMNRHHSAAARGELAGETDIEECAAALVEMEQAETEVSEYWRAIRSAAYEYRKRAARARAAFTPTTCANNGAGQEALAELERLRNAVAELTRYFSSGNDVPVERATILAKDFWRITKGCQ